MIMSEQSSCLGRAGQCIYRIWKNERYFYFTWLVLFLFLMMKFPSLSYHATLSYEDGTNYLQYAINKSILENLSSSDAGYLVIFPRIISLIAYHLFPLQLYPYVVDITGLAFISFFASYFSRTSFREIISSDKIRLFVCFVIGTGFVSSFPNYYYEYVFRDFSYWGILYCFLIIFINKESFSYRKIIFLSLFIAALCISKFHFLLFFPIYFWMCILHLLRKKYSGVVFFLLPLLAMMAQILHTVSVLREGSSVPSSMGTQVTASGIIVCLSKGLAWFFQAYLNKAPLVLSLIFFFIICFLIYRLYRLSYITKRHVNFLVSANLVALFHLEISCIGPMGKQALSLWGNNVGHSRYDFISVSLFFISIVFIAYHLWEKHDTRMRLLGLALCGLFLLSHGWPKSVFSATDIFNSKEGTYLDWNNMYSLLTKSDYFIPVDHDDDGKKLDMVYLWAMKKNNYILSKVEKGSSSFIDTEQIYKENKKVRCVYVEYPGNANLQVVAFDENGNKIAEARLRTNAIKRHKFLYFEEKVTPRYLCIIGDREENISLTPNNPIMIIGSDG